MMKNLIRRLIWLLVLLWCLALVLLGAKFAQNNASPLSVDLIFWTLPQLSSGLVLSITLLTGVLLGILTFLPVVMISKNQTRRLKKRVVQLEAHREFATTTSVINT